jgi:Fic family protein
MTKTPPFKITSRILSLSQEIGHQLGILYGAKLYPLSLHLRRDNKIKTIQSSLSIEGNTLTTEQITAISKGRKIIGRAKDVLEVKNAIKVYEDLQRWDSLSINSFKDAHKELMNNLITTNGQWREKGVGIFKGKILAHMAPPASRVPELMDYLFKFINDDTVPWLIKACVFHYELEFIHPFTDGNGRMGRLWQQLLLTKENSIFEFISVESVIKESQQQYYDVLGICDKAGESTDFITFSLEQIVIALRQYTTSQSSQVIHPIQRLQYAKEALKEKWFYRKEYMTLHKDISSATASRDLMLGILENLLRKRNANNNTCYQFVENKITVDVAN